MLAQILKEKEFELFDELRKKHGLLRKIALVFELNAVNAAFTEELSKGMFINR